MEQPAAHVGMDAEGVVTKWDEGAQKLFGYTPAEGPAVDAFGRSFQVELEIASIDETPTRFVGTISVVGSHSATPEPDSAER